MFLKIKLLSELAKVPVYATKGAACFDIFSTSSGTVEPCDSLVFDTGLSFEVPEGHVLMVFSRSGHGFKNDIRLANCVGILDSDYRGELKVKLTNDSEIDFDVKVGYRIAQAMLVKIPHVNLIVTNELSDTERGAGGFGSTGS